MCEVFVWRKSRSGLGHLVYIFIHGHLSWQMWWNVSHKEIRCFINDGNVSKWAASSEFGTCHLCKQQRLRQACASVQSCQNLRCSLIQTVSKEESSDRLPDPWPLWMSGHAQLKFVLTECSQTQICLTFHNWLSMIHSTENKLRY